MRASRRAISVASVPDDVKRTVSADGTSCCTQSAPFDLQLSWQRAGVRRPRHLPLHRLDHGGMAVAQQKRPVAGPVIDQLVALDVPLVAAGRPVDVDRERLQVTAGRA